MSIDFAALVARATAAANLVPVKRNAQTGRMERAPAAKAAAPAPVKLIATAAKAITVETAETFRAALKVAAKLDGEARIKAERDAVIALVGSYAVGGYHPKAVNDALAAANKAIIAAKRGPVVPGPTRAEQRAHLASLNGYTAGVADAAKRAADDAAARRRVLVGFVLDLRKVTTREGLHAAMVAGGRDDAHLAMFLASDAEAVEAARDMANALAREHGIAE